MSVVFVGLAWFVVQPLFEASREIPSSKEEDLDALQRRKLLLYRQIKELEMEYEIGNLDQSDYQQAREELKKEVSQVIGQIKRMSKPKK
jgi:hypothetical protein